MDVLGECVGWFECWVEISRVASITCEALFDVSWKFVFIFHRVVGESKCRHYFERRGWICVQRASQRECALIFCCLWLGILGGSWRALRRKCLVTEMIYCNLFLHGTLEKLKISLTLASSFEITNSVCCWSTVTGNKPTKSKILSDRHFILTGQKPRLMDHPLAKVATALGAGKIVSLAIKWMCCALFRIFPVLESGHLTVNPYTTSINTPGVFFSTHWTRVHSA